MKEEFLHYLWKYSLYDIDNLFDKEGNQIVVINPGEYNRDSGPDFFNSRIKIAGTIWAGNIEIHSRSSHFEMHGHHMDMAFDNIILHVVAENDKQVFNTRGEEIPTAKISFDNALYERYTDLLNNPYVIACQDDLTTVEGFYFRHWLHSLLIERLEYKSDSFQHILNVTGNDWEDAFYRTLSRYFGFRVNREPFELLAASLPFRIIRKHSDNRLQLEALLFGTAGMLEEGLFKDAINDEYYRALLKEYKVLSVKYSLNQLHGKIWKFSRLRPVNFPTIRLSQLSGLLSVAGGLFVKVLDTPDIRELRNIFGVTASEYWDDHYLFGKKSRKVLKSTGDVTSDILLINAVIPSIFVYGKLRNNSDLCERALTLLESIAPEENSITDEWRQAGVDPGSAFYSQALIHLRNEYCKKRRCLECRIGSRLISQGRKLRSPEELMLEP
jgi:hypothetical protein